MDTEVTVETYRDLELADDIDAEGLMLRDAVTGQLYRLPRRLLARRPLAIAKARPKHTTAATTETPASR